MRTLSFCYFIIFSFSLFFSSKFYINLHKIKYNRRTRYKIRYKNYHSLSLTKNSVPFSLSRRNHILLLLQYAFRFSHSVIEELYSKVFSSFLNSHALMNRNRRLGIWGLGFLVLLSHLVCFWIVILVISFFWVLLVL